eukprot:scaffold218920_cov39-Attheya_sp.AAC.1
MGRKVMGNDTGDMRPTQSIGRWESGQHRCFSSLWAIVVTFRASLSVSLLFGGSETDLGLGLEGGLEVEGRSTILGSEMAALSRSSFMDLLLDLALRVIEGGLVMGTEVGLWMFFDLDVQSVEGGGLGNGGYGA